MDSAPDVTLLILASNRCSVRSRLFERELFGQEKGTVTGAAGGLFTAAGQNTLDSKLPEFPDVLVPEQD